MPIPHSYGFLSTYPPTQCGLATFTASLMGALRDGPSVASVGVVRVSEHTHRQNGFDVVGELLTAEPYGEAAAAESLNRFATVIVQHEYGIYGGRDGESVVEVIRRLRVPSIVVLHTVLSNPTRNQRRVLEHVAMAASAVVVMTDTARRRLLENYRVDAGKVEMIAHGAPTGWVGAEPPVRTDHSSILTWGLLGPGKGIEWVVDALPAMRAIDPPVVYTVAGETHPNVLERHGEAYRTMLQARAVKLGTASMIRFENSYLDEPTLGALVSAAHVVVLPYDTRDQVTSGVLIEAVSALRPVVATGFPHALELLASGAGLIVDHRDPAGIAAAVNRILTVPGVATAMRTAALDLVSELSWAAVAARYERLSDRLHLGVSPVVA